MTKSRVFLYFLLSFVLGVAVGSFLNLPLFWSEVVILLIVSAIVIFRQNRKVLLMGLFLLTAIIGWLRIDWVEKERPDLSEIYNKSAVFQAGVEEEPIIKNNYQRLKTEVYSMSGKKIEHSFSVLVTTRKFPEYKLGDDLFLKGKIEKPSASGEFDYQSYLAGQKIFALSYFPDIERIGEGGEGKVKKYLVKLRNGFEDKIDSVLSEPHSSFLQGLLLGEKENLPKDLLASFKKTGTSHLIALSGYNITMIGRFFITLFSLLLFPFSVSFWLAALAIFLFVLMTGAAASVVRASIMGVLVLVARREGRIYHMTNALILAGALMIWQNPLLLRFDVGFQLSFLAAAGLIFLSPVLEEWLGKKNRVIQQFAKPNYAEKMFLSFRRILVETLSAQIMVLPILVLTFGQVSLVSPVVNLLVLPVISYSMFLGFLTGSLGFIFYPLSQFFGWVVWFILEYILRVIEFFSRFDFSSAEIENWALWPILTFYFWLIFKIIFRRRAN